MRVRLRLAETRSMASVKRDLRHSCAMDTGIGLVGEMAT